MIFLDLLYLIFDKYFENKGIRFSLGILRDKTMADRLMYIPNDDTQNYPFFSL